MANAMKKERGRAWCKVVGESQRRWNGPDTAVWSAAFSEREPHCRALGRVGVGWGWGNEIRMGA